MKLYDESHTPTAHDYFVVEASPSCSFVKCRWCGMKSGRPVLSLAAAREVAKLRAEVASDPSSHLCPKSPTRTLYGHDWSLTWDGEYAEVRTTKTGTPLWRLPVWRARWRDQYTAAYKVGPSAYGGNFLTPREAALYVMGAATMLRTLLPVEEPEPEPDNVVPFPLVTRG